MKTLTIGDTVPHFKAVDHLGNPFDSNEIIGKKILVLYFYPKDNTPGCTAQACEFRNQYDDFKMLGAEVIGVSGDTIDTHDTFAQRYKLPFRLLDDQDKKIRTAFGVPTSFFGLLPGRVTYVVDLSGTIVFMFDSTFKATQHIAKALAAVEKLLQ